MHNIHPTILVTGGCRSGKSACALQLAETYGPKRAFIAPARIFDREMEDRVRCHRAERDISWTTIEEANELALAITTAQDNCNVILVDCITLWLTNLLEENLDNEAILERVDLLCQVVQLARIPVILVTNETGWSIVPENPLARRFRDLAGLVNQRLAQTVTKVILCVAGIPVTIKDASDPAIKGPSSMGASS
jgi:adenosylcobinamide kinase/adenosylcobinamide-phosphate guanylyltransferase